MDGSTTTLLVAVLALLGVVTSSWLNFRAANDQRAQALREIELRERVSDDLIRRELDVLLLLRAKAWVAAESKDRLKRYLLMSALGVFLVLGAVAILELTGTDLVDQWGNWPVTALLIVSSVVFGGLFPWIDDTLIHKRRDAEVRAVREHFSQQRDNESGHPSPPEDKVEGA